MLAWRVVLPLLKRRVPLARLARKMSRKPGSGIWADPADRVPDYVRRLYRPSVGRATRASASSGASSRIVSCPEPVPTPGSWSASARGMRAVIGHAWVVVDGEPLFESEASLGEYESFFSFGRDGALDRSISDGGQAS